MGKQRNIKKHLAVIGFVKENKKRILLLCVFSLCAAGVLAVGVLLYLIRGLPSLDQIVSRQIVQSTKIYDRTGTVLLYETGKDYKRTVVPLDQIPQHLKDATLAIEDENFYKEPAFSWRGIVRAFFVNIWHGKILQGGSTITQQLARNAFLSLDQTIIRKVREFLLAVQLSRRYSKDEILGLYLNEIPYGPTVYGVEAASKYYFNKTVRDLSVQESAVLAAIPKAPSYYYPYGSHTKELFERQRLVLKKMEELGKITGGDAKAAMSVPVAFSAQQKTGILAPHFVMATQEYVAQKYGEDLLQAGGLHIVTTLDWELQQAAEKTVAEGAKRNEELYKGGNAALVAQDAQTGQILALVGSRDYFDVAHEGNFNVATQGLRQPGSALKPFAYLTAFQKGYTPNTVLFDLPTEFAIREDCPVIPNMQSEDKRCFHPGNFDAGFSGPISMRNALAQSVNIPAVKTLYLAGLQDALDNLHVFGITTLNDYNRYGLSLVLGGGEVRLIELVGAYSVLAQDGIKHRQTYILEIKNNQGKTFESYRDQAEQVVDPQYPRLVNNILSDINARRPLFQNSLSLTTFDEHDVALKTGTSNDYRDAWTVGYTPSIVVGVWAGNNDNSPMQRKGSSILAAIPIWHSFMSEALKTRSGEAFNRPESPALSEKPMIGGNYAINNEVHSILYYVDKANPLGPPPVDPRNDSQFLNWETPVLLWAEKNSSTVAAISKNIPIYQGGDIDAQELRPIIEIISPQNGMFFNDTIFVSGSVRASSGIKKIAAYFNGTLSLEITDVAKTTYDFSASINPRNPKLQNILRVEATDSVGRTTATDVILYR